MNYREHECTLLQTPPISLYGNKGSSTDTVCHRDYWTLMKYTNCCAQLHVETKGYILSQLWPKSMSLVCFFYTFIKKVFSGLGSFCSQGRCRLKKCHCLVPSHCLLGTFYIYISCHTTPI